MTHSPVKMDGFILPRRLAAAPFALALLAFMPVGGVMGEDSSPRGLSRPPATFSRDVAPIFQKACQHCHRPGQGAPMSLLTYRDARPWAKSIRRRVAARSMPPWDADREIGEFLNDPSLTEAQIATIVSWVDRGAPEGDPADLPPALVFEKGWSIGEPDLALTIPEDFELAAAGPDRFEYFELPTGLTEERWVSAVQIRPGNPEIVHHVMAYVREEEQGEWLRFGGDHGSLLIEYAVGNRGDVFAEGTGRPLQPGSSILLEVHYHPSGEAGSDRTSIGLKFHPKGSGPHRRVYAQAISARNLHIPAGADDVRFETTHTFRRPIRVISFQPHMHGRGRSMTLEAILPGGRSQILCSVPTFDYNWQITYTFARPPDLPAGTVLKVSAVYDNSANNPNNPDPGATVWWGPETTDEMMIGWTDYVYADEEDPVGGTAGR